MIKLEGKIVKSLSKTQNSNFKVSLLNNDTFFKINEILVLKYKITVGFDITNIYDQIMKEQTFYEFYDKALRYSSMNFKSSFHVKNYLIKKQCEKHYIDDIIYKLTQNKIIDDSSYMLMYTNSLICKGYGRNYIKNKLIFMKFNKIDVLNVLDNIDEGIYFENLEKQTIKKLKTLKQKDYQSIIKLKNFLFRRGYELELVADIVKMYC